MTMLAGFATAALLWWGLKVFGRSNPRHVAQMVRWVGGILAMGAAVLLGLRGRLDMAMMLGGIGAWLMGWAAMPNVLPPWFRPPSWLRPSSAPSTATSRVRSATLEMELDHASGRMSGAVLAGAFAGRRLEQMSEAELGALLSECLSVDPEGARLLEAYLDRRSPGWREHAEADADGGRQADPKLGAMTQQEAYQVLGLEPGADAGAVRAAHRLLMKKLHPDQGGSTYLASRVNQAKDVLLDRHR